MLTADRIIALTIVGLSVFFMWHATVLPIGWEGKTGPGGGSFPFWLSAVMLFAAAAIFLRSFQGGQDAETPFFDPETIRGVGGVTVALLITIFLMPIIGTYIALMLFLFWYLRIFGGHSRTLTAALVLTTPVFLFFFFEVTLKILLPKGMTEPLFLPLYAMFF